MILVDFFLLCSANFPFLERNDTGQHSAGQASPSRHFRRAAARQPQVSRHGTERGVNWRLGVEDFRETISRLQPREVAFYYSKVAPNVVETQ
jgi:hypothetical protein